MPLDEDELQEAINNVLGTDEEHAIHDYEAFFPIHEYENVFRLNERIHSLQKYEPQLIESMYEYIGNLDGVIQALEEGDYSCYHDVDSLEDVAYETVKEGLYGSIPESIQSYIDYGKLARDLSCDGWSVHNRIGIYVY